LGAKKLSRTSKTSKKKHRHGADNSMESDDEQEGRYMKSSDQISILENEFAKDPFWSKQKMKRLAEKLQLKES
jgi:hypothetical protein